VGWRCGGSRDGELDWKRGPLTAGWVGGAGGAGRRWPPSVSTPGCCSRAAPPLRTRRISTGRNTNIDGIWTGRLMLSYGCILLLYLLVLQRHSPRTVATAFTSFIDVQVVLPSYRAELADWVRSNEEELRAVQAGRRQTVQEVCTRHGLDRKANFFNIDLEIYNTLRKYCKY